MSSLMDSIFYFHNYIINKSKSSGSTMILHACAYKLLPRAQPPHLRSFPLSNRMRAPQPRPTPKRGHVGAWPSARLRAAGRRRLSCPGTTGVRSAVGAALQAPPPAGARAGARAPGDGPPALKGRRLRRPLGPRPREGRYGGQRAGATTEGRAAAGT